MKGIDIIDGVEEIKAFLERNELKYEDIYHIHKLDGVVSIVWRFVLPGFGKMIANNLNHDVRYIVCVIIDEYNQTLDAAFDVKLNLLCDDNEVGKWKKISEEQARELRNI